ncbi:MAG: hypothetical protein ACLTT1_09725 [[Clostridium] scindens]
MSIPGFTMPEEDSYGEDFTGDYKNVKICGRPESLLYDGKLLCEAFL